MKVKILSEYEYQSFPIVNGMVDVKEEDLKLIGVGKKFDLTTNTIVEDTTYQERKKKEENQDRIIELKALLKIYDYIDNKLIEALILNDTAKIEELKNEYASLLAQRQAWRDEINRIEQGE